MNVTGRDSRPIPDRKNGGHFIERIQQGAFGRAVKRAQKVSALLDHDWGHVVGDTGGSLTLKEHDAARWLRPDELDDIDWMPADALAVRRLKETMAWQQE